MIFSQHIDRGPESAMNGKSYSQSARSEVDDQYPHHVLDVTDQLISISYIVHPQYLILISVLEKYLFRK